MTVEPIKLSRISVKKYQLLAGLSRHPMVHAFAEELEHYADEKETYIGVLLHDRTDNDFAAIVQARDEHFKFSCMDLKVSFDTISEAREWLIRTIKWHSGTEVTTHEQGRPPKKPIDIFTPIVSKEKQHIYFQRLISHPAFRGARKAIAELMPHYVDVDGNFVQQFQSDGFDSRLWELYLFAMLKENNYELDKSYSSPDFLANLYGYEIAIEATVVGRRSGDPVASLLTAQPPPTSHDIESRLRDEMPIMFGSPLYSKLKKKYWELEHVKGVPFILAIADFHDDFSMIWSSSALFEYLYGKRYRISQEQNGDPIVVREDIQTHTHSGKSIPSAFFNQPNTEHISAILTSASGTISKFNRIGRQAGYGDPEIRVIRTGTCYDHTPGSIAPKPFSYEVTTESDESWSEGVNVYHNPHALVPLSPKAFPLAGHHYIKNGDIVSLLPDFHPYASWTHDICPKGKELDTNGLIL